MRAYRQTETGKAAVARAKKTFKEEHRTEIAAKSALVSYNYSLKRYGITRAQYDAVFALQGGKCAVCGTSAVGGVRGRSKMLCVDHDHKTGKIRGLLCRSCNIAAGSLKDDPDRALLLAEYLKRTT
ncbi:MAG: hypothetical protein C0398_07565 [Coprothermobacter sp.]|nr:hypothetical protein [Coprothermobacter sp.]